MIPSLALSIIGAPDPDRGRLQELQGRLGVRTQEGGGDGRMDWIRRTFGDAAVERAQQALALQSTTLAQSGAMAVAILRMHARQDPGSEAWSDPAAWPSMQDMALLVETAGFRLDQARASDLIDALGQMQLRLERELSAVLQGQNLELEGLDEGLRVFLSWVRRRIALRDVEGPWPDIRWLYDGAVGLGITGHELMQMGVGALSARSAAWHGQGDMLSFDPAVWSRWQDRVDRALAQGWAPPAGDVLRRWPSGFTLQDISLAREQDAQKTLVLLQGESAIMQHCVGQGGHGSRYARDCATGRSRIWSLRDPQGYPVLTFEVELKTPSLGPVGLQNVRAFGQIYGPQNTPTNPAHAAYLVDLLLSREAAGVALPESISKLLSALVEPHMTAWEMVLQSPVLALSAAVRMRDRLVRDLALADQLRRAVCVSPLLAWRFAQEVDQRPDDLTRQVASGQGNLALSYAEKIDKGGHPVTRAGVARDPRDAHSAASYWVQIDAGAPHGVILNRVIRHGHRDLVDRGLSAMKLWLASYPPALHTLVLRAVGQAVDEADLAPEDLGLIWGTLADTPARAVLLPRMASHPGAIIRAVSLHMDHATVPLGEAILPPELALVVASSPVASALVLRAAMMSTRAKAGSFGRLPVDPQVAARLVPSALSTRLSIAILMSSVVGWERSSYHSYSRYFLSDLLRWMFPDVQGDEERAVAMMAALVSSPWGVCSEEEENEAPVDLWVQVLGWSGFLRVMRVLVEAREVRVPQRRSVVLEWDPDRILGLRFWGTGPFAGQPVLVEMKASLSVVERDGGSFSVFATRSGWVEVRHNQEVLWTADALLRLQEAGAVFDVDTQESRVALDPEIVAAAIRPMVSALPPVGHGAADALGPDVDLVGNGVLEPWDRLAKELGAVLRAWPEVAARLQPLPWLALVPAALSKDAPPAVLAALATAAGRRGLASSMGGRFGRLEPHHIGLVLKALRQADRTTTVPWPDATGRVPRIPKDVEMLVGALGDFPGQTSQDQALREVTVEGVLAYPPVFRWKARSSEEGWSDERWRERTWNREVVYDSPLGDLEERVLNHVVAGIARALHLSPDPKLRAAAVRVSQRRRDEGLLEDPALRFLRPVFSSLIAWSLRSFLTNEEGFQDTTDLRILRPLQIPGWSPPPSLWSAPRQTALALPSESRAPRSLPSLSLYLGQSGTLGSYAGFIAPPTVAQVLSGGLSGGLRLLAGGAIDGRPDWRPEVPTEFQGGEGFLGSRDRAARFARRAHVPIRELLRDTQAQSHVRMLWLASTPEDAEAHAKTMIVWRVEPFYLPVLGMVPSLSESGQVGYTLFLSGSMPVTHQSCPRFLTRRW